MLRVSEFDIYLSEYKFGLQVESVAVFCNQRIVEYWVTFYKAGKVAQ